MLTERVERPACGEERVCDVTAERAENVAVGRGVHRVRW